MQQLSEWDVVRRWASGELLGIPLRTTTGERLTILYAGRPGGGAGPDFRDAVIRLGNGQTLCGDVELHLRGGFWRSHGHQNDPRYQRVILHVVLENDLQPTRLPDGQTTPVLALADVVMPPTLPLRQPERWPCQEETTRLSETELLALLNYAGRARFLEKPGRFVLRLRLNQRNGIYQLNTLDGRLRAACCLWRWQWEWALGASTARRFVGWVSGWPMLWPVVKSSHPRSFRR